MRLTVSVYAVAVMAWGSSALPVTPADKCEAAKNKIAGKYASCVQKAYAKAVKTGALDVSKCNANFGTTFTADERR